MFQLLIRLTILLFFVKGYSEGNDVTQTPSIILAMKGNSSQMNCSHNKGSLYYQMYWYRQRPGENIQLIVFTSTGSGHDFGDFKGEKYAATKSVAESGSFTVNNLEPGDTGVYFCAVSQHSAAD